MQGCIVIVDYLLIISFVLTAIVAVSAWSLKRSRTANIEILCSVIQPRTIPFPTLGFRLANRIKESSLLPILGFILPIAGIIASIYFLIIERPFIALGLALVSFLLFFSPFTKVHYSSPPIRQFGFYGRAQLPKRVYEGDSQNILIELKPALWTSPSNERIFKVENVKTGKSLQIEFAQQNISEPQYIEVEFLCAGISVDGEKKQRQPLKSNSLPFRWNCHFQNSGHYSTTFIIRLVNSSSATEIGIVEHSIKVVKFLGLTQRQVWILATIAGILSGSLAIMETLRQLGIW